MRWCSSPTSRSRTPSSSARLTSTSTLAGRGSSPTRCTSPRSSTCSTASAAWERRSSSCRREDGVTVDTQRLIEAIDERTAFVNVSHVLFKSAYIHDVAAIAARAARGRRDLDHRRLSVRRRDPGGRRRARRRRLRRRLSEVALRRPGGGVPVGPPRASGPPDAQADRLDGARSPVRLRSRALDAATTPGGSSTARRTSHPSTPRWRAWR